MARYLVMKRDNDIEVVKEEQSQIVSLSFGDFIEESNMRGLDLKGLNNLFTDK